LFNLVIKRNPLLNLIFEIHYFIKIMNKIYNKLYPKI